MKLKLIFFFAVSTLLSLAAKAQITGAEKKQIIDSIDALMTRAYIFPDTARQTMAFVKEQWRKKMYDTISDKQMFADVLTRDLQSICKDKHVNIFYSDEVISSKPLDQLMSIPENERKGYGEFLMRINYGINKLEVLKGNIGYIDFSVLCGPEFAGDTYAAAMQYIAHTDALIIDFRNCGGSYSPNAVPFLCSYLFEMPTHLNDIWYRYNNKFEQSWTYAYVPGKRYLNKPVYVLVSNKTFSGAEEMAYDLKTLKRATIIGKQTGGGANPGGTLRLTEHFGMFIPVGHAVNPITKFNWEGVGVTPDSVVDIKLALYNAQLMIMKNELATTNDENWKGGLQQWIAELEANAPQLKQVTFMLKNYSNAKNVYVTGTFNGWSSGETKMERVNDIWTATVAAEPGQVMYKFIVDGIYMLDPANNKTAADNGFTNSMIVVN